MRLTRAFALPPSAVIGAAEIDLQRRRANIERGRNGTHGYARYSFHRLHVRLAIDVPDLIRRARQDLELGRQSSKPQTRFLYNARRLAAALRLAEQRDNRLTPIDQMLGAALRLAEQRKDA